MNLLTLVLILAAVLVIVALISKFGDRVGATPQMIRWFQIAVAVIVIIWLLNLIGVFNLVRQVTVPVVR